MGALDFNEIMDRIHIGLVIVSNGKVLPINHSVRETVEEIFEFGETKPKSRFKNVVNMDVGSFGVSRRRG